MMLSLYRAVAGPTVLDRLIGVNAIGSKTVALLILIGLRKICISYIFNHLDIGIGDDTDQIESSFFKSLLSEKLICISVSDAA